ncbi:BlaI/MecI/CopY family transcriptional regulator [Dermatophilaceae bacterium Soc4.6]
MSPLSSTLGGLERAVMDQLWARADGTGATVREVHEVVGTERDLAYTTLMTVLDRLAKKGLVDRVRDGRAWRYTAAASRDRLTADALRTILAPLDPDERRSALRHFLDSCSPAELDDVRRALHDLEERRAAADQP